MHSKYAAKFYAATLTSSLTPGMIRVFASRCNRAFISKQVSPATHAELTSLLSGVDKIQPRCMPEHEKSGMRWLLNKFLTPKGNLRLTEEAKEFNANDQLFLQRIAMRESYQIHFVGLRWIPSNTHGDKYAPCYRVVDTQPPRLPKQRVALEYSSTPWQSGGHFEIYDREDAP